MNKEQLFDILDYVDATRDKRLEMAHLVLRDPSMFEPLLEIAFENNNPISSRASWVIEFTLKEDISYLFDHLDTFYASIGRLTLESSIRPMAKICEILIKKYFNKSKNEVHEVVKEHHLEQIAATCFDWLIGDYKVAPKAYSMITLHLLGKKYDWIHPELKMVLEQNYATGSAGYKARARKTLDKLR